MESDIPNRAHIAALTDQYVFRGTVHLRGQRRLSDELNNALSDVVKLHGVKVYDLPNLSTAIHDLSSVVLRKRHIQLVAILREERRTPTDILPERVEKAEAAGYLYGRNYYIRGIIVFSGKQKEHHEMLREGELFIPVRKAVVCVSIEDDVKIPALTALVNNEMLLGYYYAAVGE